MMTELLLLFCQFQYFSVFGYYIVVSLRAVRQETARTVFYTALYIFKIASALITQRVQRAVTEQAVKVFRIFDLVARKILTFFVLKKFIVFAHLRFLLMYLIKAFKIPNIFH